MLRVNQPKKHTGIQCHTQFIRCQRLLGMAFECYIGNNPTPPSDMSQQHGNSLQQASHDAELCADHHVFKTPVSVRDLAAMLVAIDMTHMPAGSRLHFAEKTSGGVCMSLLVAQGSATPKSTHHPILETSNTTDWPFIPEIEPTALLQSLSQSEPQTQPDRWGLMEKRIRGLVLKPLLRCDAPCVDQAARYVLQCIRSADGHSCVQESTK